MRTISLGRGGPQVSALGLGLMGHVGAFRGERYNEQHMKALEV